MITSAAKKNNILNHWTMSHLHCFIADIWSFATSTSMVVVTRGPMSKIGTHWCEMIM